jgi:hypothetical protein
MRVRVREQVLVLVQVRVLVRLRVRVRHRDSHRPELGQKSQVKALVGCRGSVLFFKTFN